MLSVSVNSSNGNAAESVFRNGFGYTNKTLSDWILRGPTSDATYFADYIAIGCQPQWGINSAGNDGSEGESGWYAFPVNFNSACFALFCGLRNTDTNKTYTNKIMAVIHGLVVSFGLLLADSQPVTSYNPTATL